MAEIHSSDAAQSAEYVRVQRDDLRIALSLLLACDPHPSATYQAALERLGEALWGRHSDG